MTAATDVIKTLKKKKLDVSLLSDAVSCNVSEWISSGCTPLDAIMGGGFPTGRYVEILGDSSTGKTLIASQLAAVAQESGCVVVYADSENAVSREMMEAVGVDINDLVYFNPDTVEEVFQTFDEAIDAAEKSGVPLVLIWDSIAATSDKYEMEREYGEPVMASHARLISQSLRKLTRRVSTMRVAACFINQAKTKIGIMFGDKTATFGGKAVEFHASIRIQLSHKGKIVEKIEGRKKPKVIGIYAKANCIKNKVAYPFREVTLPIYFKYGIDDVWASYNYLVDLGFIQVNGVTNTIAINGEELKFTKAQWAKTYDKHYDYIRELMFEVDNDPTQITDDGGR